MQICRDKNNTESRLWKGFLHCSRTFCSNAAQQGTGRVAGDVQHTCWPVLQSPGAPCTLQHHLTAFWPLSHYLHANKEGMVSQIWPHPYSAFNISRYHFTVFWKIPKVNLLQTEFSLPVRDGLKSVEATESFWNYVPACNIYQYIKKKKETYLKGLSS